MSAGQADPPLSGSDSRFVTRITPSPNHGARPQGCRPDILILHYTGMTSAAHALERLCDPAAEVSSHYVVLENGRVHQLVGEARRAWHAGLGSWAGDRDVNSRSIGIEIVNPGHDGGLPPYPDAQIGAVASLSADVVARWAIPADRVLAHSDIAPGRKQDPGERFPWGLLHRLGVGHWVKPVAMTSGDVLAPGHAGDEVATLQAALAEYGYGLHVTGLYDEATEAVVSGFQRHFRPERVDGIADRSTVSTLRALLATRPRAQG